MAKVAVPVIKLKYEEADVFDLDVDLFQRFGHWTPLEEYTYTGRVTVEESGGLTVEDNRAALREAIRTLLAGRDPEQAERLVALLDQHAWDVSFFVDTW